MLSHWSHFAAYAIWQVKTLCKSEHLTQLPDPHPPHGRRCFWRSKTSPAHKGLTILKPWPNSQMIGNHHISKLCHIFVQPWNLQHIEPYTIHLLQSMRPCWNNPSYFHLQTWSPVFQVPTVPLCALYGSEGCGGLTWARAAQSVTLDSIGSEVYEICPSKWEMWYGCLRLRTQKSFPAAFPHNSSIQSKNFMQTDPRNLFCGVVLFQTCLLRIH